MIIREMQQQMFISLLESKQNQILKRIKSIFYGQSFAGTSFLD